MKTSFPCSSVIFTNLRFVSIRGVEMECHALVIGDDPDLSGNGDRRYRLDGFGASCAWHVFDLRLSSTNYDWFPAKAREGFRFSQRGELQVHDSVHGLTSIHLTSDNRDLEISVEKITGTWTPDDQGDWTEYNQRIGVHIFDRSCAVIEALPYQRNLLLPIAVLPSIAREVFEEDGTTFRKGLVSKQ